MTASSWTDLRKCACGSVPAFTQRQQSGVTVLRLVCACGKPCGAALLYTDPADDARMRQAGIDGWNLGA